MTDTMYPSFNIMADVDDRIDWPEYAKWSSIYGYSFGKNTIVVDDKIHNLEKGQYFSFFIKNQPPRFICESKLFLVCKLGYKCQNVIGWVEEQGRLCYIDGCTDSLLIYPPRLGDPSLNFLHFPAGITQTKHLHPSIRIGCVISGQGSSDIWTGEKQETIPLVAGQNFCLEENEQHRFKTTDLSMSIIAWHPDGNWGPTDHDHPMLNRTYTK